MRRGLVCFRKINCGCVEAAKKAEEAQKVGTRAGAEARKLQAVSKFRLQVAKASAERQMLRR